MPVKQLNRPGFHRENGVMLEASSFDQYIRPLEGGLLGL